MKITTENFESFLSGSWDWNNEEEKHVGIWLHSDHMDVIDGKIKKR